MIETIQFRNAICNIVVRFPERKIESFTEFIFPTLKEILQREQFLFLVRKRRSENFLIEYIATNKDGRVGLLIDLGQYLFLIHAVLRISLKCTDWREVKWLNF
nr:hypothetical protein [Providencia stuartii]